MLTGTLTKLQPTIVPMKVGPPPMKPSRSRKRHDGRVSDPASGPTIPNPSVALCPVDCTVPRERAQAEGWIGELEGIDITRRFLAEKRAQAK